MKKIYQVLVIVMMIALLGGYAKLAAQTEPLKQPVRPLIQLDAAALAGGPVDSWSNSGSTGGSFDMIMKGGALVADVNGRKAVTFDGSGQFLVSSFGVPDSITSNNPYSVAVWAFNPEIEAEECLVMWSRRGTGGRCAQLNYGSSAGFGAATHWGDGDMGFEGGVPAAGTWHHIVVTYSGGTPGIEKIYVDGKLNATEEKVLNLFRGGTFWLGSAGGERPFSGAIAGVQIYSRALNEAEITGLASDPQKRAAQPLVSLSAQELQTGELTKWANGGTLGGTFGRLPSSPVAETVEGKPAVTFRSGNLLQSSFPAPAEISGSHPFTLEIEVYKPAVNAPEAILSLAPLPGNRSAVFTYGNGEFGAAQFGGPDRSLRYKREAPVARRWHTITYTFDGSDVKTYVDGVLKINKAVKPATESGQKIMLGAVYNTERNSLQQWFSGSIAKVALYDSAKSYMQVRNSLGYYDVFEYAPAEGETVHDLKATLSWSRGTLDAKAYRVYLGTSSNKVAAAGPESALLLAKQPAGKETVGPVPVTLGESYYWKVDQLDGSGTVQWPGIVKMFQVEKGQAEQPHPRTRISGVPVSTATLTWKPGKYATAQSVYVGDSPETLTVCMSGLAQDVAAATLPGTPLAYGKTYYWRIDSKNGKLPPTTGEVWRFRTEDQPVKNDVTFFVTSDLHYTADESKAEGIRAGIDFMNELPGTDVPAELGGGNVKTPRAVVLCGDLVDNGGGEEGAVSWGLFTNDFRLNGEGRCCYPVMELMGNHDGGEDAVTNRELRKRNTQRKGLTAISDNGLHYSWDWDQVHCIALSKYAGLPEDETRGFKQKWNAPQGSMAFLVKDLKENVGDSGRPVIIFQHYGWDGFSAGWGWWGEKDRAAMYDAIKDYNIIGLIHGHTHGAYFQKWAGNDFHLPDQQQPKEGLDIISDGSLQRGPIEPGECFVVHITSNKMTVAHRFINKWGITLQKPISSGKAAE